MAKSSKAKKITRRDAVVLLGAGAIAAHGKPASAHAQTSQKPPKAGRPDRCGKPATVEPYEFKTSDGQTHQAMLAATCCGESRNAVFVGVGKTGTGVSTGGPNHLKPMTDRLEVDQLDEYCFMIWGLTQQQSDLMRESAPKTLGLTLRIAPK
jgi:hypothetical protein